MKRILLIVPEPIRIQYYATMTELRSLKYKAIMAPLSIATIAGLTPDDIEVDLWDEPVHGRIDETTDLPDYDLVAMTSLKRTLPRAKEISQVFRKREIPVAIGGPGVSSTPEHCRDDFDILFIGEAELIWPQFIKDWKSKSYRKKYLQVGKPDLALSPPPRWNNIADQMGSYLAGAVQTTRGCPFDCEFCESIYLFGRKVRSKPIDRVLEEVAVLERFGMQYVFFCDDNFIGKPHYTKGLLRELISMNNSFPRPIEFIGQLSIDVAKDEEMLELLADANFSMLVIGIETPNKESLKETQKYHNVRSNLIEDCERIQSYGLLIRAGMTVGYDHDTPETCDQQFEFLKEAGIPLASLAVLKALPGTRLLHRLKQEGRLLRPDYENQYVNFALINFIPKRMSRIELLSSYGSLVERFHDWRNFIERVKKMISCVKRKPNIPKKKLNWKGLLQLPQFLLSIDKNARHAILSILWYTLQHKPFMIQRLFPMILQQYGYVVMMQVFRNEFYKGIELEKSFDIAQLIDRSGISIPESFKGPYQEVFPDIHQRIYQGLIDKKRTYGVLINTFTDYLIRWRQRLDEFSDEHREFLHKYVDHVIVEENSSVSTPSAHIPDFETIMDIENRELAEEILKFVEQELRM